MNGQTRKNPTSWTRSLVVLGMLVCPGTIRHSDRRSSPSRASRWRRTSRRVVRALESLGAPLPREAAAALGRSARVARCRRHPAAARRVCAPRRHHQPRSAGEGRPRAGRRRAAAGRLHAGARQGDQRGRDHQGLAHHQPAVGPRVRGRGRAEHDAAGSEAPEATAKSAAASQDRFLQVEMFTSQPMTAEPQRAEGRIRPRPDLQQRGRQARGDARLRRRPGDAGPRLPRRGAGPVRRPAGRPGQARRPRLRRQADRRPLHLHATRRAASIRRRPSGSPPTSSSRSRSTAHDGGTVLLPPGEFTHDLRPRARSTRLAEQRDHRPRRRARRRVDVKLERWINPIDYGFYSGDHHIHAAGCAHYTNPTEGVCAEGHVPARQGRGAQRRLQPDLGAVLRLPAAVLRADAAQAQRAVHRAQVRRRGQRLRLAGARATSAC